MKFGTIFDDAIINEQKYRSNKVLIYSIFRAVSHKEKANANIWMFAIASMFSIALCESSLTELNLWCLIQGY